MISQTGIYSKMNQFLSWCWPTPNLGKPSIFQISKCSSLLFVLCKLGILKLPLTSLFAMSSPTPICIDFYLPNSSHIISLPPFSTSSTLIKAAYFPNDFQEQMDIFCTIGNNVLKGKKNMQKEVRACLYFKILVV